MNTSLQKSCGYSYTSIPIMGNGDQFLRHLSLGSIFVIDYLVFKVASITFYQIERKYGSLNILAEQLEYASK